MRLWYRLRNGAYFVDFILLIAAVVAMIGLATFVHLHTAKAHDVVNKQTTIGLNNSPIAPLSPDTGAATNSHPSTRGSAAVGPSDTSSSVQLQSAMSAPEVKSKAVNCTNDCAAIGSDAQTDVVVSINPSNVAPIKIPKYPCNEHLKDPSKAIPQSNPDTIACTLE